MRATLRHFRNVIRADRRMVRRALLSLVALAIAGIPASGAHAADDTALRLSNVSSANTAYVRVANDAAFSLQQFTLEAWVQRVGVGYGITTDPSGAAIIAKPREGTAGSNIASWHLHWTNSGQVHFNLTHTPATSGVYLLSPAVATPLARHHLAVTFDGATIRIYIDGAWSAEAAWNLGSVYYGADDVLIGADNFAFGYLRRFDGFIDDVRVWDHARTATEIATAMNCRLSGAEPGLVAYWTFDASNLADATGHGHTGVPQEIPSSLTYAALAPITGCAVGVDARPIASAAAPAMSVFPQPTRGPITMRLDLPRDGWVTLDLFDVSGRRTAVLASRRFPAGRHEISQDITALGASGPGSGLHFLRLRADGETVVRPLIVVR